MRIPRILALRQTQPRETIRRKLVVLDAVPVAQIDGVQLIMTRWWNRSGGYPVGRVFASWRLVRA